MTYTAALSGATATITLNEINNTSNLKITDAANLGDELLAFVTDTAMAPVDNTPAYQAYPTDTGIRITNPYGEITLPWRWVHSIGTALNA